MKVASSYLPLVSYGQKCCLLIIIDRSLQVGSLYPINFRLVSFTAFEILRFKLKNVRTIRFGEREFTNVQT